MKQIILSLAVVLCLLMTASADLPSCEQPDYNSTVSRYEYLDGLNTTLGVGGFHNTTNLSALIDVAHQTKVGVNLTTTHNLLLAIKYLDAATSTVGGVWIFENTVGGNFHVVIQDNDEAWAYSSVTEYSSANWTWYKKSQNEDVMWWNISEGWFFKPVDIDIYQHAITHRCWGYGYFYAFSLDTSLNATIAVPVSSAAQTWHNFDPVGDNEYLMYVPALGWGNDLWGWNTNWFFQLGVSTEDEDIGAGKVADAPIHLTTSSQYEGSQYCLRDMWGCGSTTGSVVWNIKEGAGNCVYPGNFSNITCEIAGDTFTGGERSATLVLTEELEPSFRDSWEHSTYYNIHEQGGVLCLEEYPSCVSGTWGNMDAVDLRKMKTHTSLLTIIPYGWGLAEGVVINHTTAWYLRYDSPTGSIDDLSAANITFGTHIYNTSMYVDCYTIFGVIVDCPHYNFTKIVGYNSTYYRKDKVTIHDGTITYVDFGVLSNDLDSLLDGEYENNAVSKMESLDPTSINPVSLVGEDNSIHRFFLTSYSFYSDTGLVRTEEAASGDNEAFTLWYTYTNYSIGTGLESDGYAYGSYQYNCYNATTSNPLDGTDGLIDALGTSTGTVVIDAAREFITIELQRIRPLWFDLYLTKDETRLKNAWCLSDIGYPSSQLSDSEGRCRFEGLNPLENLTVSVGFDSNTREGYFPIGDYYNSQQLYYPWTLSCKSFDGGYTVYWDVTNEKARVQVSVVDITDNHRIKGAAVYWNGEYKGLTDNEGGQEFYVPWNFSLANLTVYGVSVGYSDETQMVYVYNTPFGIQLQALSEDARKGQFGVDDVSSSSSVIALLGDMRLVGVLIIILTGVSGAASAGLPGGMLGLSGSALLLALIGLIPWLWAIPVIFLAVVVGAVGWSGIIRGNPGGG